MRSGNQVRRHLWAVLTVAAIVALSATSAFAQSTWIEPITVTETGGGSQTINIGVHPGATNGVDAAIDEDCVVGADEVDLPPLPPAAIFDARSSFGGVALIDDYRAGTLPQAEHRYTIDVQRAVAGAVLTFTWDQTSLASKVVSASIFDGTDTADMLTTGTFSIAQALLSSAAITLTSVDTYVPPDQLIITAQPFATGTAPMGLGTITVKAQTAGGAGVTTTPQITASVGTGLGTLYGSVTQIADGTGLATFSDLIYDNGGAGAADPETATITFTFNPGLACNAITVTSANISVATPPVGIPVLTVTPGAAVEGSNENQTPTFTWGVATNAVSYQINLGTAASAPGCDDILSNQAVTGTTYTSGRLADGVGYCGKVRSVDGVGTTSPYSATATFDVIPTFGEWGMMFLIASMVLCGGYYLQRRRVGSNA
jgi:hypothetical protein